MNRRRSRNRWWRRLGHQVEFDEDAGCPEMQSSAPSPEQALVDRELGDEVARQIAALSPRLRDTLLLAQAGLYTYEEIAAMLGSSTGTVKWRVAEARRVVRRRLSERAMLVDALLPPDPLAAPLLDVSWLETDTLAITDRIAIAGLEISPLEVQHLESP